MLEKYFDYKKHKTDFKTEVIASVTTFLTMAYIMFLNPFILSGEFAGPEKGFFEFGAVYTATIVATALACFIMAFYGKTSSNLQMELGKSDEDFKNDKGNLELVYNTKKYGILCERRFEVDSNSIVVGFVSNGCF